MNQTQQYTVKGNYKDRMINMNHPVYAYRNLTNGKFSIRQYNKVVAHYDECILVDCDFKILSSGKERAMREQVRNVHAFIRGYIFKEPMNFIQDKDLVEVTYNPFCNMGFYRIDNNEEIDRSKSVFLKNKKAYIFK